jgi:hypothetical protein
MCVTASAVGDPSIIQPGLKQWVTAAQTGRADMWFLGDSIAGPFNGGMAAAAAAHFGLAGTGLGGEIDNLSYTITPPYPLGAGGWDTSLSAVPANRQDYVLSIAQPATAGTTPAINFTYYLSPGGELNPQAAYDWHVWTASAPGGGSMQADRGSTDNNNAILQTLAPVATMTPASGLQHSVFHLDATTGHDTAVGFGHLTNVTNTSILYSRLIEPGAKGMTLTTWGYGGHDALQLYTDKYLGGPTSQAGRAQFLSALTDGGSGKLTVVLEEGTNDAGELNPSVHGITPPGSPAAFLDNMTSLIDGIASDWAAAGKPQGDLSFLVLGMYQYGHRTDAEQALHRAYAQEVEGLAQTRSDVSFVDLYDIAPTWDQANALGYMADDVHPTLLGATVYANGILDQVVNTAVAPEPTGAAGPALLGALALLAVRKRPRTA